MALPLQTTSFLGRDAELAEVTHLLARSEVRLLTICGPGGMGKTRLALAAATAAAPQFASGAAFAPLHTATDRDEASGAIAAALGLTLTSAVEPLAQISAFLHDRQLLLVLDNLEHLPDIADLVLGLLTAAPTLKVLATSREALQLQEEWLFPLAGLAMPHDREPTAALELFFERARQVGYAADAADRAAAVQICRLVGGMPLALELAAAWTRTLSCTAIAAALTESLDLLHSNLRNLPERHRSLRAVCDQSWALLSAAEQRAFRRLAVFRGDVSANAAAAVAGADLLMLDGLIRRSLLRRSADDRYQIHELLRQYGTERLKADPTESAETRAELGRYYGAFLNEWFAQVGLRSVTVASVVALTSELTNLRAAWDDIVAQHDGEALRRAVNVVMNYYFVRGPYREGAGLVERALEQLRTRPLTPERAIAIADALIGLGWFAVRAGRIAEAQRHFAASVAMIGDRPRPLGDVTEPLIGLAMVALIAGDYREAVRLGTAALQRAEAEQHPSNQSFALYVLVGAALTQGQYAPAERYAVRMMQLVEQIENTWFLAYCAIERGHIAAGMGDYITARRHYRTAYQLREPFGDPQGMAVALAAEGSAALAAEAPSEARQCYARSLELYAQLGDRGGLAEALHGYGRALLALGDDAAARDALHQALTTALSLGATPLQLALLVGVAELLSAVGAKERSLQCLRIVVQHPAADRTTSRRAHQLLLTFDEAAAPPADLTVADPAQIALGMLEELAGLTFAPAVPPPSRFTHPDLVETLTEREHAILIQIAAGHSNQLIAEALICSVGTVKWHTTQIYGKLGVKSRTQAVAKARELGLLG